MQTLRILLQSGIFSPETTRQHVLHLFDPPPAGVRLSRRVKKAD